MSTRIFNSLSMLRVLPRLVPAFLILTGTTLLHAQSPRRSFSADQVRTAGTRTTTSKIYVSGNAVRVETEQRGRQTITIMRLDRKIMWVMMPAQKMYTQTSNVETDPSQFGENGDLKAERVSLGSEQVGSYSCEKYRVHSVLDGREYAHFEWTTKELGGLVVKMQSEKGDWTTEYRNIHAGPQDPSLFEVPAGYQKMNLSGMLKP